jgi:hypothetical protein
MGICQSEPGMRRGEMKPHLGQWERALCGAEGRLGTGERKNRKYSPFRGPTGGYGQSVWDVGGTLCGQVSVRMSGKDSQEGARHESLDGHFLGRWTGRLVLMSWPLRYPDLTLVYF